MFNRIRYLIFGIRRQFSVRTRYSVFEGKMYSSHDEKLTHKFIHKSWCHWKSRGPTLRFIEIIPPSSPIPQRPGELVGNNINRLQGSVCFDEYGRPFIIVKDQDMQERLTGMEAIKSHILAAHSVALKLRTSLGPKGLDKLLVSPEGEIVITNDGATILDLMDVDHQIAKLLVELARAQDLEVGDGTTGVVVLAGALLEQAVGLLEKGIHPVRIADGFELAAKCAVQHLEKHAVNLWTHDNNRDGLIHAAMTALGSKIVSKYNRKMAEIAVAAIKAVSDLDDFKVNLSNVKLVGKTGGQLEDTSLVLGVVIKKQFSHPQMARSIENARIAIFSCPLQVPEVSANHHLNIEDVNEFKNIRKFEEEHIQQMLKSIQDVDVNLVICARSIDEEMNHLFLQHGINAIDGVEAADMELLAISTRARIVSRFQDLGPQNVGSADIVRIIDFGTTNDRFVAIEQKEKSSAVTIFIRGSNQMIVDEAIRSLHDALCVVKTLALDDRVVYGGGASEIACSLAVSEEALKISTLEQYAFQAFSEALEAIPITLAENSGMNPLLVLTSLKRRQVLEGCYTLGVDCMLTGSNDMSLQCVVEPLVSKQHQIVLATQLVKLILKIDDIRQQKTASSG